MSSQHWTRENLAWLAGILEGEGYFSITNGEKRIQVVLRMADFDVVRKAALIGGVGNVRGPYKHGGKESFKPLLCWAVTRGAHVYALCAAIYPFMGERRSARIRELMATWLSRKHCSPPHGTYAKFAAGCRCDQCREALRAYQRKWWRESRSPSGAVTR